MGNVSGTPRRPLHHARTCFFLQHVSIWTLYSTLDTTTLCSRDFTLSRLVTVALLYNKRLWFTTNMCSAHGDLLYHVLRPLKFRVIIGKPGGKTNIVGFNAERALFNRYACCITKLGCDYYVQRKIYVSTETVRLSRRGGLLVMACTGRLRYHCQASGM